MSSFAHNPDIIQPAETQPLKRVSRRPGKPQHINKTLYLLDHPGKGYTEIQGIVLISLFFSSTMGG